MMLMIIIIYSIEHLLGIFLNALQLLIHLLLTTTLSLLHYKVLVFFHFIDEKMEAQRD